MIQLLIITWIIYNAHRAYVIDTKNNSDNEVFIDNLIDKLNKKTNNIDVLDLTKLLGMIVVTGLTIINIELMNLTNSLIDEYLTVSNPNCPSSIINMVLYSVAMIAQLYVAGYDCLKLITSINYKQTFGVIFINNNTENYIIKITLHLIYCLIGIRALSICYI